MSTPVEEMKVLGLHAVFALFEKRPEAMRKLYLTQEVSKPLGPVMKYCAAHKRAYKVTTAEELERISGSSHHEGVCLMAQRPRIWSVEEYCATQLQTPHSLLALEGVANPHNLGALMRVAANFGVQGILMENASQAFNGATWRTAEGGGEWLDFVDCSSFKAAFAHLRKTGFRVYSTSSHIGHEPSPAEFSSRSLFLFGSEAHGLTSESIRLGDGILCIPSSGHVESLNVACAAGIILHEWYKKARSIKAS